MRLTDPVADMLTRVRNALQARHQKVDIPASRLKLEIARILKEEGYISNFKPTEEEGHKVIRIYLKYGANNEAAISKVERVSRPGCRVYGWHGDQHPHYPAWCDDRPPGPQRGCGWRVAVSDLLEKKLSAVSRQPSAISNGAVGRS